MIRKLVFAAIVATLLVCALASPIVGTHVFGWNMAAVAAAGVAPEKAFFWAMGIQYVVAVILVAVLAAILLLLVAMAVRNLHERAGIRPFGDRLPPEQY